MMQILERLSKGEISPEDAEKLIKDNQIMEVGDFAKLDMCRESRTGFPEAIFASGKKDHEIVKIILSCADRAHMMVTRLEKDRYDNICGELEPLINKGLKLNYNERARILVIKDEKKSVKKIGKVGIITAGTSDIPVAEEARVVAEEAGCETIASYDVGVAGIHRLFSHLDHMMNEEVQVIIVAAGMEGALPSVVAGMVDVPVIGLPTSVGYGVGEGGFTALYSMLQSCAPGIAVVNIDNGFGAGVFAVTLIKQINKSKQVL
ncbi:MAG: nickel pincer cofactor biosynthesis protein LarB [Methanobacteriaceae archaeon]|nr:nickel pincer cofactor biosynthesis protein LarB [Methanobacteriaceae archaeon]MDP2836745.1 nickel pincer cofactor biosynthesis protein LarB [Methanobacteriaceae archaeon]MDP3034941.1 nickel pincer cofactor biosynthesis protein LarB [Methanobacteriaceae archaeon]MDP3485369.1 nickel pincer cofactor biosynthesis protein LarB [Methanobacteriaceae archaeon]MDP3622526.1 nickel pincer cofactor biosynthesis protein LarB [Methanobacteriaceae archaeon]